MGNHISRIVFQARPQFSIKYEHLPRSCEQKIGNVTNFKTFLQGALTDVEPGNWGGHQVSGHGTDVSNHVL